MATTKALHEALRARYMGLISAYLNKNGEEVLVTGTNELSIPCVDDGGNDEFLVLTFKIPTGSRDGEAYDGYAMADEFKVKQAEKQVKAAEAKAKKDAKIAKDKADREARAKAKADHEAQKAGQ